MRTKPRLANRLLPFLLALAPPEAGLAMAESGSRLCDLAAYRAAGDHGVPVDILLSITRVETGRGSAQAPWPWTINADGQSHWFDTAQEAMDFAAAQLGAGSANFDVGCFQVNLKWHPDAFASLDEAFDPARNADYAARFLAQLFEAEGDWKAAVASYHSQTPDRRTDYIGRIEAAFANQTETALPDATTPPAENPFPLLLNGEAAGFGSLVPRQSRRSALIGATP